MKINLLNTQTKNIESFEPVDAREILAQKDTIYKVVDKTSEQIGVQMDSSSAGGLNIPQLQGGDAEMQTGAPIDKYRREAVVKALPGDPSPKDVLDTKGNVIPNGKADMIAEAAAANETDKDDGRPASTKAPAAAAKK